MNESLQLWVYVCNLHNLFFELHGIDCCYTYGAIAFG
jgi:hypothetical protein